MSMFDPNVFLNTEYNQTTSTRIKPLPAKEVVGYIKQLIPKNPKPEMYVLDIIWTVDDEECREVTGMPEPTVRQGIFLEMIEGSNPPVMDFSEGKNVKLGRIREAIGQNVGDPWIPQLMIGGAARILITQRPDDNDPDTIYNDVKSVGKLA